MEALEPVELYEGEGEKIVYVESQLLLERIKEIVGCLRDNADIFAWVPANMPRIDRLVDNTSGYHMWSLLDAFSRYHQISMFLPNIERPPSSRKQEPIVIRSYLLGLRMPEPLINK